MALLLLWSLTLLLQSFAGQVQAVVLVRSWQKWVYVAPYLTCSLLLIADWSSLLPVVFFFFLAHLYFSASGHASRDHKCRRRPPGFCPPFFIAYVVQPPLIVDFSSSVANSRSRASQLVHKKNTHEYENQHELGWIRTHDIDLSIPGSTKTWYATGAMVAIENRSTRSDELSVVSVAAPKSCSVYICTRSTTHLSGPHENISHEFHVYLSPQTKPGCTSEGWCDYQGIGVSNALLCGCNNFAVLFLRGCYFWSIRSPPRRDRGWVLSEISEKRAKRCILSGTLHLFLGSWCMERLKKKTWHDIIPKLGSYFEIVFTVRKIPTAV